MSVRKKFDELGENPRFEEENAETGSLPVRRRTYSFRPARRKKDTRVYAVGFIPVYGMLAVSFTVASVLFILHRQGAFSAFGNMEKMLLFAFGEAAVFLLPAVFYALLGKKDKQTLAIHRFSPAYATFIVLSLVLVVAVEAAGKYLLAGFFSENLALCGESLLLSDSLLLLKTAVYVLVPAVCEELFFRGALQTELSRIAGGLGGILCTSFAMALMHFSLPGFFVYFFIGCAFGVLRHICGSCVPGMLVHVVLRFVSLAFSAQLSFIASERAGGLLVMAVLLLVLLTVLLFYLKSIELVCLKKAISLEIAQKDNETDSDDLSESDTYIRFHETPLRLFSDTGYTFHKFWRVCLSPAMILATLAFLLITLL